jgi:hypothetical protein
MKIYSSALAAAAFMVVLPLSAAPIFKCTTADGHTIFSNTGCGTTSGVTEVPDVKINRVGSLSDGSVSHSERQNVGYERLEQKRATASTRTSVIKDSSIYDKNDHESQIRRRLNVKEAQLDVQRRPDPEGLTIVRDHSKSDTESNLDKAQRLRTEAFELGY